MCHAQKVLYCLIVQLDGCLWDPQWLKFVYNAHTQVGGPCKATCKSISTSYSHHWPSGGKGTGAEQVAPTSGCLACVWGAELTVSVTVTFFGGYLFLEVRYVQACKDHACNELISDCSWTKHDEINRWLTALLVPQEVSFPCTTYHEHCIRRNDKLGNCDFQLNYSLFWSGCSAKKTINVWYGQVQRV